MKRQLLQRIQQCMAEKKMTQADLSRATGIRPSSLSDYFSGKYSPKQDKIDRIAAALEVSPGWLMGYPDTDSLTESEWDLICRFRHLSREDQQRLAAFLAHCQAKKD
ncbi:helix-turn-helix transcriptional regulator [uncultured Megasphaera sp.]|nr:helix-turn-helix transcriptional regulator [uncultured Megasphaera sp.]